MAEAMSLVVTGRHGQLATALAERAAVRGITLVACGRPELDLEHPAGILGERFEEAFEQV
jgi:dTDP-4-dehydrorhamnose reductase